MSRYAVDACFLIKSFVAEEHSTAVVAFTAQNHELVVPDLFFPEVTNVLWKKVKRGQLEADDAKFALGQLQELNLEVLPTQPLVAFALDMSLRLHCSAYDATYFAAAAQSNCPLIAADRRFYDVLVDGDLRRHVIFIEDVM